jgi:hypothetical protein
VTPRSHDPNRSLAESALIQTMDVYISRGTLNEHQLAQFCKDLIQLTGDQPEVRKYIDSKALQALEEQAPWG